MKKTPDEVYESIKSQLWESILRKLGIRNEERGGNQ